MSNTHPGSAPGESAGKGGQNNANHPFSITIVVGGQDQKLQVRPSDLASDVLQDALKKSKNVGQPLEDWELKTEAGVPLALTATLGQLNIGKDETLFASLRAGAAG